MRDQEKLTGDTMKYQHISRQKRREVPTWVIWLVVVCLIVLAYYGVYWWVYFLVRTWGIQ